MMRIMVASFVRLAAPLAFFAFLLPAAHAQDRVPVEAAQARTVPVAPLPPSERAIRRTALRESLGRSVAALDARLAAGPEANETTRNLSNAALAHLLLDRDAGKAEALLRRVLASQEMTAGSPTYGAIPWEVGPSDVHDENSIEFATQAWGVILAGYGDRLPPTLRDDLVAHARASFAALGRHHVKASYTNIFLMKAVCLILMGEAVGDEAAVSAGYDQLDQWLTYTRQNGIHEFGSPTYYGVTLNSLVNGYRYARRAGAHEKFSHALDFFWADICAHYFAGREELAGPHSRDYDFLRGGGGLELYLYAEGMKEYRKGLGSIDLEKVYLTLDQEPESYHPSAALLSLANAKERVVEARWDEGIGQSRYTYLTPDFALGSTSTNYGPQDKMVNLLIASPKSLPNITLVADDSDAPYGKKTEKDRSGHSKPHHLPLNAIARQNKGTLLLMTDVQGGKRTAPDATSLATNLLLPTRADAIAVNGVPVATDKPFTHPVALGDVIGVREGVVGVAVRVMSVMGNGDLRKEPTTLILQADADGLRYGVARLTAYHARETTGGIPSGDAYCVFLLAVARCATREDFDALQKRVADAPHLTVGKGDSYETFMTRFGAADLILVRDSKTGKPVAQNGDALLANPTGFLIVNGVEVGLPLLTGSR